MEEKAFETNLFWMEYIYWVYPKYTHVEVYNATVAPSSIWTERVATPLRLIRTRVIILITSGKLHILHEMKCWHCCQYRNRPCFRVLHQIIRTQSSERTAHQISMITPLRQRRCFLLVYISHYQGIGLHHLGDSLGWGELMSLPETGSNRREEERWSDCRLRSRFSSPFIPCHGKI